MYTHNLFTPAAQTASCHLFFHLSSLSNRACKHKHISHTTRHFTVYMRRSLSVQKVENAQRVSGIDLNGLSVGAFGLGVVNGKHGSSHSISSQPHRKRRAIFRFYICSSACSEGDLQHSGSNILYFNVRRLLANNTIAVLSQITQCMRFMLQHWIRPWWVVLHSHHWYHGYTYIVLLAPFLSALHDMRWA